MIFYKSQYEIELLRKSNLLVSRTHGELAKWIKPGITTKRLDEIAETFIRDNGGVPGFLGYGGFPATLCMSVNSQVVHGIPSDYALADGDIVSVDCGVIMNGYYGDSAYTYPVGDISESNRQLLEVTKASLYKGIEQAVVGKRIGDIGFAVQSYVEGYGYSVVRDLVGHGVGRALHEDPQVPNHGRRGKGVKLQEGLVIAIEPMINIGTEEVSQDKDGWTIRTADGACSAHFEHTIAVKNGKADILSTFSYIEEVLNKK